MLFLYLKGLDHGYEFPRYFTSSFPEPIEPIVIKPIILPGGGIDGQPLIETDGEAANTNAWGAYSIMLDHAYAVQITGIQFLYK